MLLLLVVSLAIAAYAQTSASLSGTVHDPQGNAVTKTAAAAEAFEEAPLLIRPNVTAGDGTTSLTVKMVCRRPRV